MGQLIGLAWLACLLASIATPSSVLAARPPYARQTINNQELLPPISPPEYIPRDPTGDLGTRTFTLRHIYHHGAQRYPRLHRYLDIREDTEWEVTSDNGLSHEPAPKELSVRVAPLNIQRLANRLPSDIDDLLAHADFYGRAADLPPSSWTVDVVDGPNTTDKATILSFAKMAANAYVQKHSLAEWLPVGGGFNYTDDFGWEADGLRGHIFADEKNHTVVIGLKGTSTWFDNLQLAEQGYDIDRVSGTSPAVWDGSDTTGNDKLNDNLFGSCCCGQGGPITWKQVCTCMTSTYTCNSTCLVISLREKSHYYRAVRELYHNVTERYPTSEVWLSGHSLGGVVSSLLGLTYGLPTLTFEAFPDALAASRLGLPTPPGYRIGSHQSRQGTGIYHVGHTADPIYMGSCNGGTSFCSIAGYAFQGLCHTGKTCIYDTVGDFGWRVGIGTHKIVNVIKDVLDKYDTVPACEEDTECQDCYNWKFYESNGTDPITTTTSTSTVTRTRTETCKTPGWWGCLDESTTTTNTKHTTSTSTTSTSTCQTPGWFGCKDETSSDPIVTTTITTTTTLESTSSHGSKTCETPGWFGCKDSTTTTTAQPSPTPFQPTPTHSQAMATSQPRLQPTPSPGKCISRAWYGLCKDRAESRKNDL